MNSRSTPRIVSRKASILSPVALRGCLLHRWSRIAPGLEGWCGGGAVAIGVSGGAGGRVPASTGDGKSGGKGAIWVISGGADRGGGRGGLRVGAARGLGQVEHHAALPYGEIGAFMAELRKRDSVGARALEFAILSAARTNEALGARWDEFRLHEKLWIVPGARMKAGREHRVALSAAAVAIVERMAAHRQGDFVFPGGRAGRPPSQMAMLTLLRRMDRGGLTTHGFRSTFRDWCAEQTSFPAEAAELALAHVVNDKTEASYRRGDMVERRRQLAEAWANFCTRT
jgi:integrase